MSTAYDLTLIGIGTGNPDHVTAEAARAMREADLILIPRKGADKADLADLRKRIVTRICTHPPRLVHFGMPARRADDGYLRGVEEWHDAIAGRWQAAIASVRPAPARVALLIWGDPSLYDSSLRIAGRLDPPPRLRVIPGITALQALTAAHAIPLNEIGAPFSVTTGRRLRQQGWPEGFDTVAVMLDGACSFQTIDPAGVEIWWGAFLGMEEEILIRGPLAEVGGKIAETRARARTEHGWIMDIYLMRRAGTGEER